MRIMTAQVMAIKGGLGFTHNHLPESITSTVVSTLPVWFVGRKIIIHMQKSEVQMEMVIRDIAALIDRKLVLSPRLTRIVSWGLFVFP